MAGRLGQLRPWYARRGISWVPLLACLLLAAILTTVVHEWPDSTAVVLPPVLGLCAAAAAFVFDEAAVAVVAVTPRHSWAHTTRLAVALLPLVCWLAVVGSLSVEQSLDRVGWSLAGFAAVSLAAGLAAVAVRRGVPTPGAQVAGAIALLTVAPLTIGPLLDIEPVFPTGEFSGSVLGFWAALATAAIGLLVAGLRRTS